MPKTKKLFDWEVYENEELIDVLTMTRDQMKHYKETHPNLTLCEINFYDGENDTWKSSGDKNGDVYNIRVSRRRK
jgi:hypothetical protein